jgi:ATP-dependent Clp protease protease subunit
MLINGGLMNNTPGVPRKKEQTVEGGIDLRLKLDPKALSWDLFLFGDVDVQKSSELIQHLLTLDNTDIKSSINLLICSPGGSCAAGYALIDVMLSLKHPVRTIALGEVCSMGALVFLAGSTGMRLIGTRSMLLFHPLSDVITDYSPYIKDRLTSINYSEGYANDLMTRRTSLTPDLIAKANNGELWLDATNALKHHVADEIITDKDVIAKLYTQTLKKRGGK